MRFMVMVRSTERMETGVPPSAEAAADMMRYNEELAKAGVLLAGDGLLPSTKGAARVRFSGKQGGRGSGPTVIDGPFTEAKELIAGYWVIQARSLEEAIEWVKRVPNTDGEHGEIEIRQVAESEDFGDEVGSVFEAYRGRAWGMTDRPVEAEGGPGKPQS
jgi:hypothetical protein